MDFIKDHFTEGGWGMWPILVLLIITLYITVERTMYLLGSKVDVDRLMSLLKSQIVSGNVRGAISTCEGAPSPLTRIIAAGLRRTGGSEHDIQQAMDEEALRELPKIEKRTGYLAMLGNLATLAGLLGTITGLIKSFAGVGGLDPALKATALSKGISEAMNCTAFGLGTGILGLAAYAVLNGQTQAILDAINQGTVEALNLATAGRQEPGGHPQ
jgi:biopolymer transport protein ExbB